MKTTVLFFFTIALFYSCTPYQYLTITNNTLPVSNNTYTAVNSDSLYVSYNFDGYNAVLRLTIENKSSSPVIIDWKKSAVITNGNTASLYNSSVGFTANASFDTAYNSARIQSSTINGQVTIPGENDFIPPHASINKKTIASINGPFNLVFTPAEKVLKDDVHRQKTKVNAKTFTLQNSPGKIRVYLTYNVNYGANKSIETEFFVSEILSVNMTPDEMKDVFGNTQPAAVYTY